MTAPFVTTSSVRTGATQHADPAAAAGELFGLLQQPDLKLVVFFCAASYDLPRLADELRQRFGSTLVIGCTTAGEIGPLGYLDQSISGLSLAGDAFQVEAMSLPLEPFDSVDSSSRLSALLDGLVASDGTPPATTNSFGFLLIDAGAKQEEKVVSCLHQQLHGIGLIGGSAGDGLRFGHTYVYHNGTFETTSAVLVVVRTTLPFQTFRTQHFLPTTQKLVVTGADAARRVVHEINGLPAAEEYARAVGLTVETLSPLDFATHPVIVRVGGEDFVRSIGQVYPDGSLQFYCAIDEGLVLTVARGVDLIENLETTFAQVRELVGTPQLIVGCDCVFRRLEMDRDGIRARVGEIFAANQVVGFATYGEQYNAMHVNQTFTGIAIGEPR